MKFAKWGLGIMALAAAGALAFGISQMGGGRVEAQVAPGGASSQHYQELLAQQLGISVDKLQAAQKAANDQLIDEAVKDGKLTQEQADKMKSGNGGPFPFFGFGGPGRPGGMPPGSGSTKQSDIQIHGPFTDFFAAAATALGMTPDQLKTEMQTKSLKDIAAAHGVDADALKAKVLDAVKQNLQQAVKDGKLTQDQADAMTNGLDGLIEKLINGPAFGAFKGQMFPGGPGMRQKTSP